MPFRLRTGVASFASAVLTIPALAVLAAPAHAAVTSFADGHYIVRLAGDGIALTSSTGDFDPQADDAKAAVTALEQAQQSVADDAGAVIDANITVTQNAFTATLTAEQATALADDSRVVGVVPDSTLFLEGVAPDGNTYDAVTAAVEGPQGSGVVVGMIDSGIVPGTTALAGEPLGTTAGGAAYLDGNTVVVDKADGRQFRSERFADVAGEWSTSFYSTTLVGARVFASGILALDEVIAPTGMGSPADAARGVSHGTAAAATILGRESTPAAASAAVQGTATQAQLAVYKACFLLDVPNSGSMSEMCTASDVLAAVDAAVSDGVDVLYFAPTEMSASAEPLVDAAFHGAFAAGVHVVGGAGGRPAAPSISNTSPWATTVGAARPAGYDVDITVGGVRVVGVSSGLTHALTLPFAMGADLGSATCEEGSLPEASAAGRGVICDLGEERQWSWQRTLGASGVSAAGGEVVIIDNAVDEHLWIDRGVGVDIPVVFVSKTQGALLKAQLLAHPTAQVTLAPSDAARLLDGPSGPAAGAAAALIKPDVVASGAAVPGALVPGSTWAAARVAGLSANYLSQRPGATPAEIASALVTSAHPIEDSSGALASVDRQGAGAVDAASFLAPGLVYDHTAGAPDDLTDLNRASLAATVTGSGKTTVSRTVTALTAGTYDAAVTWTDPGVRATVSPASLSLAAGESARFDVTFERDAAVGDRTPQGSLTWTSGDVAVTSPIRVTVEGEWTPGPGPSPTPSSTPSPSSTPTPSATPTTTPSATPTTTPSATPTPSKTEKPKPGKTEKPKPGKTEKPKPGKTEKPKPSKTEKSKPGKADQSKPGKTHKSKIAKSHR